jgi:ribosomal 50S subunit-recycling heat shock protein
LKSFHRRSIRPAPTPQPHVPPPAERGLPRADHALVERGLAPSRAAARALIEAGRVRCDGRPVHKPAQSVPAHAHLEVASDTSGRFVSPIAAGDRERLTPGAVVTPAPASPSASSAPTVPLAPPESDTP